MLIRRVEHPNFEFSLSLDIRCDPHILKAIHEKRNPGAAPQAPARLAPPPPTASTKAPSGFKALFASPRKPKRPESVIGRPTTPAAAAPRSRAITIADFFSATDINGTSSQGKADSTGPKTKSYPIAKTHVAFKPIAKQCEAKVLEIRYPMFAMFRGEAGADASQLPAPGSSGETRKQVAKITLQVFRLPPLPGLEHSQLPECIDDALRGIRHHAWWECEYHEGVLTQSGGDCAVSRIIT
jgi:serine/arginine repetitive matrix protein 2